MVDKQKLVKFFTCTLKYLDIPFIKTEEEVKLIDENFGNQEKIQEKISKEYNVKINDFNKYSLPVIAVLSFDSIDSRLKSKDIIEVAVNEYGKNKTSVLPSDYVVGSKYRPENQWFLERTENRGEYILSELGRELFKKLNDK